MPTDKKISELPVAANVNGSDISVLVSGGSDYQYNFTLLLQFLSANIQAGASISFGTVLPQNNTGKNGDVFINTSNGTFAQKLTGTWTIVYTLPATNAADGTLLYGAGLPGSGTGKDMDSYINTLTGIFYKKSAGAWSQVFSMATGPQGPQGTAGTNGTDGTNGNTILFGAVNPSNSSTGVNGDFYINTSTYLLFGPKASGNWGSGVSLIGSSGPAGSGITPGGTAGQLLAKVDAADYNTHWIDAPTGGGTPVNVADNFTVNYHSLTGPQVLPSRSSYFFGDSITVGFNATPVSRRWSTRMAADIGTTEINKGINGTCMSNIVAALNMITRLAEVPTFDSTLHDYIFYAYGVNDAANSNTTAQFETDYNTVISDAISKGWPLAKIVIVSPSFQSAANNTACGPFVTSCQTVATVHGVKFINVYAYMQANGGLSLVSGDNVHPTNAGYLAIYNSIMASLNPITIGISKVNGLQLIAGAAGLTIGADFADISNLSGKTGLSIPFLDAVINSLTVGRGGGSIDTNTALGLLALAKNTTGHDNTAIGWQASGSNTTGINNIAIGGNALNQNTDGNYNIAIGYQALTFNDPTNTVAIGNGSCTAGGNSGGNVGVGSNTLQHSTSDGNVAVGGGSLQKESTGGSNTAVGNNSSSQLTTGSLNASFGQYALLNNISGNKNTAIGSWAILYNLGNNNVALGYRAGYNSNDGLSDKLWISNSELNNLLFGDFNTGQLKIGANVTGVAVPALNPHAQLELPANNMGFMTNRLTTTQRDAITVGSADEGLMIYNLTTHKLNVYDGSAWKEVTSS